MDFLNISSPTYLNLVRASFSNAKLEHDEFGDSVTAITLFLMGTPILLTLEELASKLNLYYRVLHLILTWNLKLIKKHVKLRNTDYWWLDYFKSDRRPDLALMLFNDITKAIGKWMNTNITLPHALDPVPPLPSSSHAAQPFSKVNSAILDAIHSLSNDI
ncbi:hypothetical protein Golax_023292 [Gossypium laxum]|uniref:Uncharacterized protein n=1 Tax=Gossypium laxum TaxID=34288 RepID=A0A7J9B4G2_9ROSI|nr:hypothetical protein [Gossypium laxum]